MSREDRHNIFGGTSKCVYTRHTQSIKFLKAAQEKAEKNYRSYHCPNISGASTIAYWYKRV